MKRTASFLVILSCAALLMGFPVRITSWQLKADIKKLNSLSISVDYVNPETQTIIAYVNGVEQYNQLSANGFAAEVIPDIAKSYADELWEQTKDSKDPLRAYYTLTEYTTFLQNTVAQYPNLCQLSQFGTSAGGRPLYFLKISDNVNVQENEPEFRFVSSMHGDEVVGYDLCIRLIQLLTTQYTTNARISNIVNNTEIWICPMMNPDGYISHSRYNDNGSDLNRNFPLPVGTQHPDGMATQPETAAIMAHGNDHSINMSLNFHGGALVANYPWDYIYPLSPDNNLFIQYALAYASHNSEMYNSSQFDQGITNGAAWYIAEGTLQDWVYANNNTMDITVEVSEIKWPNSSSLDSYWNMNQESMLTVLEFVQKGVYGLVTNEQGTPLEAVIDINTSGTDIKTDPQVGDYHRVLLPGTYTLSVYADGYQTATANITVTSNSAIQQNFVLLPTVNTDFSGTVINQTGAPVPNAAIKITAGISVFQAVTDAGGAFNLTSLPAGACNLTISAAGYASFVTDYNLTPENNRQIIVLPNPIFSDTFESGLSNWTVNTPWAVLTQVSNHVLTDSPSGNYANNLNIEARLTNPVSLVNVSNPSLSFDLKYNLENNYDFLTVYASANGSSWNSIAAYTGVNTTWQTVHLPLTNYAGSSMYLKFRLSTDTGVTADGVYIDNVVISGLQNGQSVYGDTDANWMINRLDVQNILEYSVANNPIPLIDTYPWEAFRIEAADVDNDNQITATDAYYVYDRFQLYSGAFPAQAGPAYTFFNPGMQYNATTGSASLNLTHPQYLKALTLQLNSNPEPITYQVEWNAQNQGLLTAENSSHRRLALIAPANAVLADNVLNYNVNGSFNSINLSGLLNATAVNQNIQLTPNDDLNDTPVVNQLLGVFPNPVKTHSSIMFTSSKAFDNAEIKIYNTKGQNVENIQLQNLHKGTNNVILDGRDSHGDLLANGVYYYKITFPGYSAMDKFLILR